MRDLLANRRGRLLSFFLLYVTEGIPLGFTAVAIAAQMRRRGLTPGEIGLFVASLYLPWGWKWLAGPVVDLVHVRRFGRRRGWIVACQAAMAITLLAAVKVDFVTKLSWFTWIILIHNAFAATMDVAIDALAVSVVPAAERGLINGVMFAGAYLGNAVGGAGVLFLTPYVNFNLTFLFVAAAIVAVTLFVSVRLREPPADPLVPPEYDAGGGGLARVPRVLGSYTTTAARAIFGSRAAVAGLAFALLPAGAQALGLALQSNLAVELGLSDPRIATLSLVSTVVAAAGCVIGGMLSDRLGRRVTLGCYVACTAAPTLAMAWAMQRHGWIMPIDPNAAGRPVAAAGLLTAFWATCIAFSFVQGLIHGTRTALFMDLCNPAVAATQFTAYMALMNLVTAYTAAWQGQAVERFGYPTTLVIDSALALACLAALPFMARRPDPAEAVAPAVVPAAPAVVPGPAVVAKA